MTSWEFFDLNGAFLGKTRKNDGDRLQFTFNKIERFVKQQTWASSQNFESFNNLGYLSYENQEVTLKEKEFFQELVFYHSLRDRQTKFSILY